MDYDSESSCEDRLRDLEASEQLPRARPTSEIDQPPPTTDRAAWRSVEVEPTQPKVALSIANRSLSTQVMEYYQKYSQNSNLDQYFSLPSSSASTEGVKYYYSIYEVNSKLGASRESCIGQDYNLRPYIPRERRRWVRPPLIGQSSGTDSSSTYVQPLTNPETSSPEPKRTTPETILEERNESRDTIVDVSERKVTSPASSVASHKPLEWDSGADVGYFNTLPHNKHASKKLSTIERMALARGCSAALRLDPEGTTESGTTGIKLMAQTGGKTFKKPDANSTPKSKNVSGSESEVEITPIVKNHLPGVITGDDIKSEERNYPNAEKQFARIPRSSKSDEQQVQDTPKISGAFKVPTVKYATEGRRAKGKQKVANENSDPYASPLKKSSSMNILAPTSSKLTMKRSQSELNLRVKDKNKVLVPLIFNSTSSLATVVNKPVTCDKLIQTSITTYTQESIGIQVSVIEEEKPLLPKRGTSLVKNSVPAVHSILKNSKSTYKVRDSKKDESAEEATDKRHYSQEHSEGDAPRQSSSEASRNESAPLTPQPEDTGNITGRANSFEYFPGHIYENVPNGSASHVSSIDTGRSNSTMPNTSSSFDEKLWGDSDSLVRDLERSVNILKSLVDANKCDKQVKKRLIHHVVKRLVTAKYTDDKIEHNLEENVPWNPDDARKKVYRAEIIQALTKKQNTTDSSDEWKPQTKKKSASAKKPIEKDARLMDEIITLESSTSDKFDGHTDRTEMDGRKARMGLRTDDCQRSSNTPSDPNKSESSECFLPQRGDKGKKIKKNVFSSTKRSDLPSGETSTSNTPPSDQNRILLEAVVNRQAALDSSNDTEHSVDWRVPTTCSERQFELKRCSNSDSGDTKLVSYAEMEKKNQLIWITNEISHLSNLKKLLEQPKKLERPKSSPRKTKHAIAKQKPLNGLTCICGRKGNHDNLSRNTPNTCGSSVDVQWSSHCNLAANHPATNVDDKSVRHVKKRNSSTQTASTASQAHSKTGGEIVSAQRNPAVESINIHIQTLPPRNPPSPPIVLPQTSSIAACPVHQAHIPKGGRDDQASPIEPSRVFENNRACQPQIQTRSEAFSDTRRNLPSTSNPKDVESFPPRNVAPAATDRVFADFSKSIHRYADSDNNSRQKETKNQLNATKSKCTCEIENTCRCVGECNCGRKRVAGGGEEAKKTSEGVCQLCAKKIAEIDANAVTYSCDHLKGKIVCACPSDCNCENKRRADNAVQREHLTRCNCANEQTENTQSKNPATRQPYSMCHCDANERTCNHTNQKHNGKLCRCPSDCTCENRSAEDAQSTKKLCDCHSRLADDNVAGRYDCPRCSKMDTRRDPRRPYYLTNSTESHISQQPRVQNNPKCHCVKDCSCANKIRNVKEIMHNAKRSAKSNYSSESRSDSEERSCRCCRNCGSAYQNGRKCGCRLHYPKPVAYELSFVEEVEPTSAGGRFLKHEGVEIKALSKLPLSNSSPPNTAKSGGCSCEEIRYPQASKPSTSQRNTLQDYLAINKPGFLNNIETRRQCMSEISHLRELRKEKRVQLLAMASGSNVIKTPRNVKQSVCVQRKLSNEEMKERLRKRYLRLNEVRFKKRQQEKQEETRRNKLMASIFCKKLQQKVLKGQVDLSHSISVISNL